MRKAKTYTLTSGEVITAKQLAKELNITIPAARFRLNKSLDANILRKSTYELLSLDSKVYVLSDGTIGTIRELSRLANIADNTIRLRLSKSLDYDYVMKKEVFESLGANIYLLSDGSEITAKDYSLSNNLSLFQASATLKAICISTRQHVTSYTLDDGQVVTLTEIMEKTGLSKSGAKKRLKTRVASLVLKPSSLKPTAKIKAQPILKHKVIQLGKKYRQVQCQITGKLIQEAI